MLLLDTHLVLWLAFEPARLSRRAVRVIEDRSAPLAYSLATLWEVAIKTSLGRPDFAVDVMRLRDGLQAEGLIEAGITASHLARIASLPWVHRDPFDRLLVSQAIEEGWTLLTTDRVLKGYGRFVRLL